ncbi:MAG: ABC transporter permease, partial [Chloroflexi bacterium]|nr:ABC transporter permease [Chloroflexota bacterium]
VGRDVFRQVLYGARVSLVVGFATVVVAGLVGSILGIAAGVAGGKLDSLLMRVADIQLALPAFLLAILTAAVIGPSVTNVIITLALTRWVVFARVARSAALAVRHREFVDSARILGASPLRVTVVHIVPACIAPLLVVASSSFGLVVLAEASLSFLGLGTPASTPSWGQTIANGRDLLPMAWWISTLPGVVLAIVTVTFGIFGDALRDHLDPHMEVA